MILDVLNGANWPRSLPKMIDSNKNFKANVSDVVVNTFPADG